MDYKKILNTAGDIASEAVAKAGVACNEGKRVVEAAVNKTKNKLQERSNKKEDIEKVGECLKESEKPADECNECPAKPVDDKVYDKPLKDSGESCAANTPKAAYNEYAKFIDGCHLSHENGYLLKEIAMEVVNYCFKCNSSASMEDVLHVLYSKKLKNDKGVSVGFPEDLDRVLKNYEAVKLFIAIIRLHLSFVN